MATADECATAIAQLAAHFGRSEGHRAGGLDRSVSATVTDLGLVFHAHLHDGVLDDITTDDTSPAQIRLVMTSDDLLALAAGNLSLGPAWLSGRIKVHASFPDLLRLRAML